MQLKKTLRYSRDFIMSPPLISLNRMRDNIQVITIEDTDILTANNWSEIKLILKMTPGNKQFQSYHHIATSTRVASEWWVVSNFSSLPWQLVTLIHPDPHGRRDWTCVLWPTVYSAKLLAELDSLGRAAGDQAATGLTCAFISVVK